MIRTKAYLIREIAQLKKRKAKLIEERETVEAINKMGSSGLKKTIPLIDNEITHINEFISALYWVANTSEKQLPRLKKKKKKKKVKSNSEEKKKE